MGGATINTHSEKTAIGHARRKIHKGQTIYRPKVKSRVVVAAAFARMLGRIAERYHDETGEPVPETCV